MCRFEWDFDEGQTLYDVPTVLYLLIPMSICENATVYSIIFI